jgi:tetratricopeptide (TPR) repeat protein
MGRKEKARKEAARASTRQGPAESERVADAARAHHVAGRLAEAREGFRRALALDPSSLDATMNLGVVLAQLGCQREAPRVLKEAMALAPREPVVHLHAGQMLAELGRWAEARKALERAVQLDPRAAPAYEILGYVHLENGRRDEAVAALQRSIALDPFAAATHYRLHCALFDDRDPGPAIKALAAALERAPEENRYRLCLGALLELGGDAKGARVHLDMVRAAGHEGADASWRYAMDKRAKGARLVATTRETLLQGLDAARPDGLVVELGVRYALSTRWIAERAGGAVHGFDSFQGLPEAWHVLHAGTYSTQGELPEVPASVELHVGTFDATLPPFLAAHSGPVRFMNVDCDLYSSTKTTFDLMGDRIGPGTVIVFDEYIVNDRWAEDEFKAFQEAVAERGWTYEYLAFSVQTGQGSVRIAGAR